MHKKVHVGVLVPLGVALLKADSLDVPNALVGVDLGNKSFIKDFATFDVIFERPLGSFDGSGGFALGMPLGSYGCCDGSGYPFESYVGASGVGGPMGSGGPIGPSLTGGNPPSGAGGPMGSVGRSVGTSAASNPSKTVSEPGMK